MRTFSLLISFTALVISLFTLLSISGFTGQIQSTYVKVAFAYESTFYTDCERKREMRIHVYKDGSSQSNFLSWSKDCSSFVDNIYENRNLYTKHTKVVEAKEG